MFCAVYRLRQRSEKLDPEAVRAGRAVGDLSYRVRLHDPRPGKPSVWCASLVGDDGERYVLPVLDNARMGELRGKGFLIYGEEVIPVSRGSKNIRSMRFRQTWYCVPVPLEGDW